VTAVDYMEKVAVNEVSTMWKSDEHGYVEERKSSSGSKWVVPENPPKELTSSEEGNEVPF
jgi:hypothetical protein